MVGSGPQLPPLFPAFDNCGEKEKVVGEKEMKKKEKKKRRKKNKNKKKQRCA